MELGHERAWRTQAERGLVANSGGEGGIRTPGRVSPTPVFKTGAINHSATSPLLVVYSNVPIWRVPSYCAVHGDFRTK